MQINPDIIVEDKTLKQIKDEAFKADVYSTDEVKTDKVWTDGSPIYRTTIVSKQVNGDSCKDVTLSSVGVNDIKQVVDLYGTAYQTSNNMTVPVPYIWGGSKANITQWISIYVINRSKVPTLAIENHQGTVLDFNVTLEYTKATE